MKKKIKKNRGIEKYLKPKKIKEYKVRVFWCDNSQLY